MVFGLPAACYAMYKTAYPQNREKAKGILLAAGLTSFFTGITEPIEFSFIFISPLLWVFHAFMAGTSFLINTFLVSASVTQAAAWLTSCCLVCFADRRPNGS
ncbi:MAG: PTS transporter subunit EIIC [Clostridium sp.]